MEMYFMFCEACNCFEYDCHGLDGCIKLQAGYKPAHARAAERQERLVELVKLNTLEAQASELLKKSDKEKLGWHELTDKEREIINQAFEAGLVTF